MNFLLCCLLVVAFIAGSCQGAVEPMVHKCINDVVQSAVGDMIHLSDDSIPFDSTTDEKTPKKGKKDKKKHKRSTTTHSMRIHSVLHSTARDKSFFTSSSGAFQRAISLFGNTFKVDRRESKLTLQPKCLTAIESGPNAGKCKKIDNSQLTCGIFDVPDQLKGPGVECKEKAGSCKTKTPSGAGVDADFIMFAGARDDICAQYGSSVLAFAAFCGVDDQHHRPAVGYINVCYKNILSSVGSLSDDIVYNILQHEMIHAFGFTSSAMKTLFRDSNGNLYNPVSEFNHNGKTVPGITSPKVLSYARDYYDCPTLEYVPLEDGGGRGSASSHWEARVLHHEMMMAFLSSDYMVLSNFTLAFFEDSGWYGIDYDYTNSIDSLKMKWGKGLGCDFLSKPCTDKTAFPYSCVTHGCTYDHISKGVCNSWSQFFDGCRVILPASQGSCLDKKSGGSYSISEVYGETSRCFEHRGQNDVKVDASLACLNTSVIHHSNSGLTAYKIQSSESSSWCEEGQHKLIDNRYVHCPSLKDITLQQNHVTSVQSLPNQFCHSSCQECAKPKDPNQCTSCKPGRTLDGPSPNSCCEPSDCMSSPTSTTTSPEVSTSYKNGDVRLANGNTDHEGYVQVYSDGSWGHICHNKWQTPEAIVVCRQLGFPVIGAKSTCCSKFGNPTVTPVTFLWDKVGCKGTEDQLSSCRHSNTNTCPVSSIAGVRCPKPCQSGETRLIGYNGGQRSINGRAAVCHDGRFKPICNNEAWNKDSGRLFCKSIGMSEYGFVLTHSNTVLSSLAGENSSASISNCNGRNDFKSCNIQSIATSCRKSVAGIHCLPASTISNGCTHGNLRLVGSDKPSEGHLQVCMHQVWGNVCDLLWDPIDATVACKQLGFSDGNIFSGFTSNSPATGDNVPVFLNFVKCSGSENALLDCQNYTYLKCSKPAAVKCSA